ncbi:MAG: WSD1 family O-acyltransferase, partial [Desulfamplus sp.]|nr:WSD1 family O-acyltransferase [Desulfamplus sp.]
SLVFLRLPIYLEDPVLRLKEVKRRMDELKTSPDPYINFGLLSTIGALPSKLAQKAAQLFGDKASGVLTNVPGPREPLYFGGKKILNFMFWVPRSGMIGLGISIMSYNGNVTIGIACDDGLMPDPETLLQGVEQEFNELIDLVHSGKIYDDPLVINDRYEEAQQAKKSDEAQSSEGSDPSDEVRTESDDKKRASSEPVQCKAITKEGKQCSKTATEESRYCHLHQSYKEQDTLLKDVEQIMKELAS